MANNQCKNVFISHVHEDDALLDKLKTLASKAGVDLRDASIKSTNPNDATSTEYIKQQILAPGIKWAGVLVVLISHATHLSWWVNWEIEYAVKQGKQIVGVYAQGATDADLPPALEKYGNAVVGWHAARFVDAICGTGPVFETPDGRPRAPVHDIQRYSCG